MGSALTKHLVHGYRDTRREVERAHQRRVDRHDDEPISITRVQLLWQPARFPAEHEHDVVSFAKRCVPIQPLCLPALPVFQWISGCTRMT